MSGIITTSSPAEDILTILSSNYGTLGVDLFTNEEPIDPDNVVTVYDTGSSRPPLLDSTYEYPTVQVRIRRRLGNTLAGKQKARDLMNYLHGYVGAVGSVQYTMIKVVNGPIPLGNDGKGRPRFTFNLEIQRTTVS